MAFPWIFANLAAGNQPASKLDDNFNALGTYATVPCTAAGTNAITLTPVSGTPTIGSLNQLQSYRFLAAATSTSAVTIQVLALGFLPAYYPGVSGPVAANSGNVVIGECYDAIYDVALNSGAGGFHLYNVIPPSAISPITHVSGTYTTNTNLSTLMLLNDTVPLNTAGTQVISISVVTTSATQRTRLRFSGIGTTDSNAAIIGGIFQGSTCILAFANFMGNTIFPQPHCLEGTIELVVGSSTTTTFTVRVGPSAGNARLNGSASSRYFGGVATCILTADTWEP